MRVIVIYSKQYYSVEKINGETIDPETAHKIMECLGEGPEEHVFYAPDKITSYHTKEYEFFDGFFVKY